MNALLRKLLFGVLCIPCLGSAGCIQVPFYVPEFTSVPSVNPGCSPKDDLHAFRVDVTQRVDVKEGPGPEHARHGENFENFELTKVQPASGGATPQQVGVNASFGWCYVGFWNYCTSFTSHSIALRLYRAGFETIELKPGQPTSELQWQPATTLAAQEKAVDDLLGVSPLERVDPKASTQQRRLESGTKSAAHRDALLFAAGEYERISRTVSPDLQEPEARARLIDKANRLRAMAKGR
jgi:hypothetical protein